MAPGMAAIPRGRGHKVTTPTQTGLGERYHLLPSAITLGPFVPPAERGHRLALDWVWPVHELACGHDAMVVAPAATADLLHNLAG